MSVILASSMDLSSRLPLSLFFLQRVSPCVRRFSDELRHERILWIVPNGCPDLSELTIFLPLHYVILSSFERLYLGPFDLSFTAMVSQIKTSCLLLLPSACRLAL